MTRIFSEPKRIPKKIVTDNGKEFYNNSSLQALMKKHGIHHYSTFSILKASIAEHVIRTIKEKLFKLFTLNGKHRWIDLLEQLDITIPSIIQLTYSLKMLIKRTRRLCSSRFTIISRLLCCKRSGLGILFV